MTQNNMNKNMALGFLFGAIVGSTVALLYAPAPGKEIRTNLKNKYDEIATRIEERRHQMAHQA